MAPTWEEVVQASNEKRKELVLQGQDISSRIDKNGLDENIFELASLNYLEISSTSLACIQSGIGNLVNLKSLVLCNNQLKDVPSDIGKLSKLKTLNLSNNKLVQLPDEIELLSELDTMNLSANGLEKMPSVRKLKYLHILNMTNNKLSSLPDGIFVAELVHLSQILAGDNEITELSEDVQDLPHLNTLDLSNNKLTVVPTTLGICHKLKELNLKGNKFKDRRFGKMVEQCQTKSVLEYLHNIWKKENQTSGKDKKKKKKGGKQPSDDVTEITKNIISVLRLSEDKGVEITVTPAVLSVRQYIVCCVIRNLDLGSKFKGFITLQTKLHDTSCQKRQAATIATHDLRSVKLPLKYDAKFPQHLQIIPLFKQKEVSGEKLFADLRKEADELRKEKKRNNFSGIHKYLELLADKTLYPCLVDRDGDVISFPPITNSDRTKISKDTTDILVEITSSTSLDTCKKIMDELLFKMLEMGLGSKKSKKEGNANFAAKGSESDSSSDEGVVFEESSASEKLVVEQVKIVDIEGGLKVLYPSRTDLISDMVDVVRNFD